MFDSELNPEQEKWIWLERLNGKREKYQIR